MPGLAHELMVQLIKDHPDALEEIIRAMDASLSDIVLPREYDDSVARFTDPTEVRPDVVLGRDPSKPWIIVDVQLNRDNEKIFRWPLAWLLMRLERKRPGDLLVITHDPQVAAWVKTGIVARGPRGTVSTMYPKVLLLDHHCVEKLLQIDNPWATFAAAWSLQDAPVTEHTIAKAIDVLRKAERLPSELQERMIRAILGVLPEAINEKANLAMTSELWPNITDEQLDNSPGVRAFRATVERVFEARGEARGEAKALLMVLQTRAIAVSDEQRERIEKCTDKASIEQWLVRAVTATSADELFQP